MHANATPWILSILYFPLWLQTNPLVATLHWQILHNIIVVPRNFEYKFVSSLHFHPIRAKIRHMSTLPILCTPNKKKLLPHCTVLLLTSLQIFSAPLSLPPRKTHRSQPGSAFSQPVTFSGENSLSSPWMPVGKSRETRLKGWFLYCKLKLARFKYWRNEGFKNGFVFCDHKGILN